MKRGLVIGGVAVVLAVGILVYFVFTGLGAAIKAAVEEVGPRVTGTSVSLSDAEVDVTAGRGALRGLSIGNPSGFETDHAFQLGEISVSLDTSTVTSDTIVVREIVIDKPDVTYEYDFGAGTSNIEAIQKNVQAFAGPGGGSSESSGGGPKLVIENLYVRDANVALSAKGMEGKKASQTLPEIHLTDIGKDSGGASPGEVAQQVLAAVTDRISGFVSGLDLGSLLDVDVDALTKGATEALEQGVGEAMKEAGGMGDAAKEGAGKAMESATDAADAAGDAVKEGVEGAGETMKKLLDR